MQTCGKFSQLTRCNVLLNDVYVIVSVVSGVHVQEAEDVHPLVHYSGVSEATHAGQVCGQVHDVHLAGFPVTYMSIATSWTALILQ